jgi:hypothetical protein
MKAKTKIWLGVGAFVLAGTGATGAVSPLATETVSGERGLSALSPDAAMPPAASPGVVIAQHAGHDAGEGGESQGLANLPPDLAFAVRVTLLRGHLLVGDELVRQQQWNAALPHFLHPTEEIYGDIRDQLAGYRVPPFDGSLKALSDVVKAKKGGAEYTKALKAVHDALGAADAGMKAKHSDWPGFVVEAAVEALKAATGEYQQAVVGNRIAKPVEYQDARGFILQADRMIESVASDLQQKDPAALGQVRAGLVELKKVFPSPMPPRTPVKDYGGVLAEVSKIELAAGKLM